MKQLVFPKALAVAFGAILLLAGAAFAQSPGFGKSGQPNVLPQKSGKAGIIIDDGAITGGRPDAIEPGDIYQPPQKGSHTEEHIPLPERAHPSPGVSQGIGAAGTPSIEPGDIYRPGQ
ncbi:MAG: hypothetical protein ACLFNV_10965 [Desulfovibrionales bacterium]